MTHFLHIFDIKQSTFHPLQILNKLQNNVHKHVPNPKLHVNSKVKFTPGFPQYYQPQGDTFTNKTLVIVQLCFGNVSNSCMTSLCLSSKQLEKLELVQSRKLQYYI